MAHGIKIDDVYDMDSSIARVTNVYSCDADTNYNFTVSGTYDDTGIDEIDLEQSDYYGYYAYGNYSGQIDTDNTDATCSGLTCSGSAIYGDASYWCLHVEYYSQQGEDPTQWDAWFLDWASWIIGEDQSGNNFATVESGILTKFNTTKLAMEEFALGSYDELSWIPNLDWTDFDSYLTTMTGTSPTTYSGANDYDLIAWYLYHEYDSLIDWNDRGYTRVVALCYSTEEGKAEHEPSVTYNNGNTYISATKQSVTATADGETRGMLSGNSNLYIVGY